MPGVSRSSNPSQRIHCLPARDPRLIARNGALCAAERVDDGALARVRDARHHQPRGAGHALCRVPRELFFQQFGEFCRDPARRTLRRRRAFEGKGGLCDLRDEGVRLCPRRQGRTCSEGTGRALRRTSFFKFLLNVAAGARASRMHSTPSTSGTFSSIMRMAFVMCPGNHWMCFIRKRPHTFLAQRRCG